MFNVCNSIADSDTDSGTDKNIHYQLNQHTKAILTCSIDTLVTHTNIYTHKHTDAYIYIHIHIHQNRQT